jgi:alanine dehydrogenase
MIIGIPKEIKNNESRVGMTPAGVFELTKRNHTVYIQSQAGSGSGFFDDDYEGVGAVILDTIEEIYAVSEMIVKVKEPIEIEYNLIKPNSFYLFSFCFQ